MAELNPESKLPDEIDKATDLEVKGHMARNLTQEELQKLQRDQYIVSDFKQRKYEIEAQKNWDLFYKRNTTKFFKDRHWTKREFSDMFGDIGDEKNEQKVILEVGCGVGNFVFPLLEEDKSLFFHACDFSHRAVQFVKENCLYDTSRCNAFQCDITVDDLTNHITACSVDAVSMIFVLSAIHPDKMLQALKNVFKVIRPGGRLLFRDYGLYDYAMLRFAPGHKLSEHFYVRQDGTRAYYFTVEFLNQLIMEAGFQISCCDYIKRETVNKKEGLSVPRIFVQGQFTKPHDLRTSVSHTNSIEKACKHSSDFDTLLYKSDSDQTSVKLLDDTDNNTNKMMNQKHSNDIDVYPSVVKEMKNHHI